MGIVPSNGLETLKGSITSFGTTSGHRFVIGNWETSPIGRFADVMWAPPDGRRILVACEAAADYVTTVYPFSEFIHTEVSAHLDGRKIEVNAGPLAIKLASGHPLPFPWRPRWVTGSVESALAQRIMGVRTSGVSPTGSTEWYRTRSLSWVRQGLATVGGDSCGELAPISGHLGFGFTEPPTRPSHVKLRVEILPRPPAHRQ